jgi:uncharacterized protein YjbI with pentapeptide repeats
MNEQRKICRYKNEITGWKCPYEALEDSNEGFCIFHERRRDKDIEKFNEGIKRILEDKESDAYHFEGFFFPSSVDFSGFEFKKNVRFDNAEFSGEDNSFKGTEFSGKNTAFTETRFLGKLTDFSEAKFSGKQCSFVHTKFESETTSFGVTKFLADFTDFFRSEFLSDRTRFVVTQFSRGEISFFEIKCKKRIEFGFVSFGTKVRFIKMDLRKCKLLNIDLTYTDFSLLDWNWKDKLLNESDIDWISKNEKLEKHELFFKTSEVYQQLKVQFHNKRDFAKAGMFHFREQECKRKACKPLSWKIFNRAFLRFLKWSCGYGEKLWKILLSSFEIILAFAIFYMFLGLHNTDQNESLLFQYSPNTFGTASLGTILKDFWTSLIFSIKGFFPLWRFQQYKVVGDFANLVAGFEFLLGAFMVGLFVYVFRRRMDK